MIKTKIFMGIFIASTSLFSTHSFAQESNIIKEYKLWIGHDNSRDHNANLLGIETTLNKTYFGLNPNFSIEYLKAKYDGIPYTGYASKNEYLSFIPTLKKQFDNGLYIKAGVGATYQKNKQWQHHRSGSHYQFNPTASIGYDWNNLSFEIQYSHFSNADTKKPNPGEDFTIFKVGFKF